MSTKPKVVVSEIKAKLESGVTKKEIMDQYGLSEFDAKTLFAIKELKGIKFKRKSLGIEIVNDLANPVVYRSTNSELQMEVPSVATFSEPETPSTPMVNEVLVESEQETSAPLSVVEDPMIPIQEDLGFAVASEEIASPAPVVEDIFFIREEPNENDLSDPLPEEISEVEEIPSTNAAQQEDNW